MKLELRVVCAVGIVVLSAAASAAEDVAKEVVGGVEYYFVSNERGATIIGMKKLDDANSKRLEVPRKLGGKRVRMIADEAFNGSFTGDKDTRGYVTAAAIPRLRHGSSGQGYSSLKEYSLMGEKWIRVNKGRLGFENVVLPRGLERIGARAFLQCTDIVSVDIPDSVLDIQSLAFCECKSLKRVVLPSGIEKIPEAVLACSGLASVDIPDGVVEIGENAFRDCKSLKSITIPDTVVKIGSTAFEDCIALEKVRLPSKLLSIGYRTFSGCTSLVSIEIPDSIQEIKDQAFWKCERLKIPTLPANVKVHKSAFQGCARYASGKDGVLFETEVQGDGTVVITDAKGSSSLQELEIPEMISGKVVAGVSLRRCSRGDSFKGIEEFENVSFPKTIASINRSDLNRIRNARCVKLLGVTNVNDSAFSDFSHLETIEMPSARRIGSYAFSKCFSLKSLVMPDSVIEIGQEAFRDCTGLTNVIFSSALTEIPYEAFMNCANLQKIVLPENLQNIDRYAFKGCMELQIESFPASLKSIGFNAFEGCAKIRRITFPEGFTTFGGRAFKDCTLLSEVYIPSSVKELPYGLFQGCTSLSVIKSTKDFPKTKYVNAFIGCPVHARLEQERDQEIAREAEEAEKAENEREKKQKEFQDRIDRQHEEYMRKVQEANHRAQKAIREFENKIKNKEAVNDGGSSLSRLLLLIVVGLAAGIFVYAKKNGYSYAYAGKRIFEKVRAMVSRLPRQARSTSYDDSIDDTISSEEENIMTEQDSIKFICSQCGQPLEADYSMVNMDLECPTCGNPINVPAS